MAMRDKNLHYAAMQIIGFSSTGTISFLCWKLQQQDSVLWYCLTRASKEPRFKSSLFSTQI